LDIQQATAVLERMHDLWGRPVNLMTITKTYEEHEVEVARRRNREPEPTETGVRLRYDGHEVTRSELDEDLTDRIRAADIDYDTKPDEWLA
jgi:stage V sporulation protein R